MAQRAGRQTTCVKDITHHHSVHDGRQHTHIVRCCQLNSATTQLVAASVVTAAHNHNDLRAVIGGLLNFACNPANQLGVDTALMLTGQLFTGEFYK